MIVDELWKSLCCETAMTLPHSEREIHPRSWVNGCDVAGKRAFQSITVAARENTQDRAIQEHALNLLGSIVHTAAMHCA
jgi:hypothetical protein